MRVTFENEVHGTSTTFIALEILEGEYKGFFWISERIKTRIQKELCGNRGCNCGKSFLGIVGGKLGADAYYLGAGRGYALKIYERVPPEPIRYTIKKEKGGIYEVCMEFVGGRL